MERLSPEAKKPPKGPIVLAKSEKSMKCACSLVIPNGPRVKASSTASSQVGREKGMKDRVVHGQAMPSMLCRADVS
jgi:hypothetical protein